MIGIAKGLASTMRRMLRPPVTLAYPDAERILPERSRTSFALSLDDDGVPACKACSVCAKNCPDDAITIHSEKREGAPGRVLTRFEIDLGLCMYCGLCVENCPTMGLRHTGDFESATHRRDMTTLVLYHPQDAAAALQTKGGEGT